MTAAMNRLLLAIAVLIAACAASPVHAEFIGNAFGGQAEENTRAGAARVFEGYQSFYLGMSLLEQRNKGGAKEAFQNAVKRFADGQKEYHAASQLLKGKRFDASRLEAPQNQQLLQFLEPFGGKEGADQAAILQAYANSFSQTIGLVQRVSDANELTLPKFREIQILINRQVLAGTHISRGLGG